MYRTDGAFISAEMITSANEQANIRSDAIFIIPLFYIDIEIKRTKT